jgi:hypothetical protein
VLPEIPNHVIKNRCNDLIILLTLKLKQVGNITNLDNEDDFNKVLVCNNACWAIGEISFKYADFMKPHLLEVMNALGDILNTDIIQ